MGYLFEINLYWVVFVPIREVAPTGRCLHLRGGLYWEVSPLERWPLLGGVSPLERWPLLGGVSIREVASTGRCLH